MHAPICWMLLKIHTLQTVIRPLIRIVFVKLSGIHASSSLTLILFIKMSWEGGHFEEQKEWLELCHDFKMQSWMLSVNDPPPTTTYHGLRPFTFRSWCNILFILGERTRKSWSSFLWRRVKGGIITPSKLVTQIKDRLLSSNTGCIIQYLRLECSSMKVSDSWLRESCRESDDVKTLCLPSPFESLTRQRPTWVVCRSQSSLQYLLLFLLRWSHSRLMLRMSVRVSLFKILYHQESEVVFPFHDTIIILVLVLLSFF